MQNYDNHIRLYPLHHFVFYPITLLFGGLCLYLSVRDETDRLIWLGLCAVIFLLTWLSFMLRQHYALNNQNRIIRLEMRFRYYVLTNKRLEEYERKLSFSQLAALRFASDIELPHLLDKTVEENLGPKEIKKLVSVWQPDYMRV